MMELTEKEQMEELIEDLLRTYHFKLRWTHLLKYQTGLAAFAETEDGLILTSEEGWQSYIKNIEDDFKKLEDAYRWYDLIDKIYEDEECEDSEKDLLEEDEIPDNWRTE